MRAAAVSSHRHGAREEHKNESGRWLDVARETARLCAALRRAALHRAAPRCATTFRYATTTIKLCRSTFRLRYVDLLRICRGLVVDVVANSSCRTSVAYFTVSTTAVAASVCYITNPRRIELAEFGSKQVSK